MILLDTPFLAGVTYLMVRSYNARVAIGLTRDAPRIMTMKEVEEIERPYEKVPLWAVQGQKRCRR